MVISIPLCPPNNFFHFQFVNQERYSTFMEVVNNLILVFGWVPLIVKTNNNIAKSMEFHISANKGVYQLWNRILYNHSRGLNLWIGGIFKIMWIIKGSLGRSIFQNFINNLRWAGILTIATIGITKILNIVM